MEQLQTRYYSREEIASVLNISLSSKTFKRDVKRKLENWGQTIDYPKTKGLTILKAPSTAEEKIQEILIRKLELDIKTNIKGFAFFFYLLSTDFSYQSSPWKEREKMLKEDTNIEVSERTLRSWASKLIKENLIAKDDSEKELWRTIRIGSEKQQEPVDLEEEGEKEFYEQQCQERKELLKERTYGDSVKKLWDKYNVVYYNCRPLIFNGIMDEDYTLLFNLIEEYIINEQENM